MAACCCWWWAPVRERWADMSLPQARAAHVAGRAQAAEGADSADATRRRLPPLPRRCANISSIVRQPNSDMIEVHYNQVVPQRIQGSLDDPAIRQLLMLASENASSAGVRDDSVGLLAAECRAGHSCKGEGMRDALMVALRYDKNEGVREKALQGLEPYVSEDMRVRDAVLEALLYDTRSANSDGSHQRSCSRWKPIQV